MRRIIVVIILLMVLAGCSEEEPPSVQPDVEHIPPKEEETLQLLHMPEDQSHYIIGWQSDESIAYVKGHDVMSFNLTTGESNMIYTEATVITDALIHPDKQYILLHTGESADSATIKIISMDGVLQDTVELASNEVEFAWNEDNDDQLLFTAFQDDWTFDLFLYNREKQELDLLDLDDPFPSWLGDNQIIATAEDRNLVLHIADDGQLEVQMEMEQTPYVVVGGRMVTMHAIGKGTAHMGVRHPGGEEEWGWEMPVQEGLYSGAVFPSLASIGDDRLVAGIVNEETSGEVQSSMRLVLLEGGEMRDVMDGIEPGPLICSPSGDRCLAGYEGDLLIDIPKKRKISWIVSGN